MKKLLIIAGMIFSCFLTTAAWADPLYTISVLGRDNAIFLDNSVAAKMSPMPGGDYIVKVTGDAYYGPGAQYSHGNVLVRYAGANGDQLAALEIGSTTTLNLVNGFSFSAFFADWASLGDNSGEVNLEFYDVNDPTTEIYNLSVHGRNNAIFLDSSVAAKMSPMPGGDYIVEVTGDAYYGPGAQYSHGNVLVRYAGANGDQLAALEIGSTTTLNLVNGYSFAAFFADWASLGDNSGEVILKFYDANEYNPVPEPTTLLLFGTGIVGMIGTRIRKKKR